MYNNALVPSLELFKVRWPDNSRHYIMAKGRPYYDDNGNPLQMNGVCWDILKLN